MPQESVFFYLVVAASNGKVVATRHLTSDTKSDGLRRVKARAQELSTQGFVAVTDLNTGEIVHCVGDNPEFTFLFRRGNRTYSVQLIAPNRWRILSRARNLARATSSVLGEYDEIGVHRKLEEIDPKVARDRFIELKGIGIRPLHDIFWQRAERTLPGRCIGSGTVNGGSGSWSELLSVVIDRQGWFVLYGVREPSNQIYSPEAIEGMQAYCHGEFPSAEGLVRTLSAYGLEYEVVDDVATESGAV